MKFSIPFALLTVLLLTACGSGGDQQTFRATVPPAELTAPVYSPTPTLTPTTTPTPSPTNTLTPTPTLSPTATPPLMTLTPVSSEGAPPAFRHAPANISSGEGWTCSDFPCEDDIEGFQQRIQVPEGYVLEHVGRLPGQPMQITYGPDGRLYATVIEDGAYRGGAVYAMNADGSSERYGGDFVAPTGLAFQPGTDVLYVSGRVTLNEGGGLWRVEAGGSAPQPVITDLPCCYVAIDNQPNGMVFGPDGYLYLAIGGLSDHGEPPRELAEHQPYADLHPYEAAILRVQPHTGEVEVYAEGLRNPFDVTFDSSGQFYATDSGLALGPGDRLLAVSEGEHFGWPYWRTRGCEDCPPKPPEQEVAPDLVRFADYSLPRGLVAYTGTQFPANLFDNLFVVLWNGTENAQRVVRIDPNAPGVDAPGYEPEPFVTGLIRPIDVTIAPDGSLVVADYIYGHVWRVRYGGS